MFETNKTRTHQAKRKEPFEIWSFAGNTVALADRGIVHIISCIIFISLTMLAEVKLSSDKISEQIHCRHNATYVLCLLSSSLLYRSYLHKLSFMSKTEIRTQITPNDKYQKPYNFLDVSHWNEQSNLEAKRSWAQLYLHCSAIFVDTSETSNLCFLKSRCVCLCFKSWSVWFWTGMFSMRIWNLSFLLALGALINFCQAELEGITDEDLKKLVVNEKYVVVLFCEYKLRVVQFLWAATLHNYVVSYGVLRFKKQFLRCYPQAS